ncbi:MAG: hypothetical protein F6K50_19200 [Moorea sp. SIO3I7]|nr:MULTISPECIES: hypothetical protein [Moorena]NEN97572.1 hypothetical protein [Moorena sp. SIO3I7]NEO11631.1 hypothetical protein [Moorena sp. SIO3E8]NEP99762.1 hypothetical protein [Moorena sp. SIO3F7]
MSQGFGINSLEGQKSTRRVKKPKEAAEIGSLRESLVEHFTAIEDQRV